jgi:hypothetical protein
MVIDKLIIVSDHLMKKRKPLPQPLSEGIAQKLRDINMGPSRDYSLNSLFRL